jgi:hypothetical protein
MRMPGPGFIQRPSGYTSATMDGRTAAMNVIGGAMLGASVPFVGAFALTQATADFRLLDHLFTLIFLAIACGAIGVVINLPWGASAAMAEAAGAGDTTRSHEEFIFDASDPGDESAHFTGESSHTRQQSQSGPATPTKKYAMSRLQALRTLDLPHDADDDEVRDAYRRMAKENHPDLASANGQEAVDEATKKFVKIREAYDVLVDED